MLVCVVGAVYSFFSTEGVESRAALNIMVGAGPSLGTTAYRAVLPRSAAACAVKSVDQKSRGGMSAMTWSRCGGGNICGLIL